MPPDTTTILLVDDKPANLIAYRSILDSLDFRLICVGSGAEALRYLLDHEVSLVVLDVIMPGLDGFEVARLIRQRESSRNTPILFLSAESADEDLLQKSMDLQAIDYLVKPISSAVLRSHVVNALGLTI